MAGNGGKQGQKQRIEHAEICKTIKKKARQVIRKYNQDIIRETIMTSKSPKKVRRTQKVGQDRLVTLLDKQEREINDKAKNVEQIEEFYTELYDSEQSTIIQTDTKEVPEITS